MVPGRDTYHGTGQEYTTQGMYRAGIHPQGMYWLYTTWYIPGYTTLGTPHLLHVHRTDVSVRHSAG